jgi:hypothetical protein
MFVLANEKPARYDRRTEHARLRLDMKLLLQNVLNHLYFRRPGVWTADADVAHDFEHSQALFEFVDQQNLHDVQIVVKVEEPARLEVVPLELASSDQN